MSFKLWAIPHRKNKLMVIARGSAARRRLEGSLLVTGFTTTGVSDWRGRPLAAPGALGLSERGAQRDGNNARPRIVVEECRRVVRVVASTGCCQIRAGDGEIEVPTEAIGGAGVHLAVAARIGGEIDDADPRQRAEIV